MRLVTFKLEEDLLERLDRVAARKRVSRSEVIREALRRYLNGCEVGRERIRVRVVRLGR